MVAKAIPCGNTITAPVNPAKKSALSVSFVTNLNQRRKGNIAANFIMMLSVNITDPNGKPSAMLLKPVNFKPEECIYTAQIFHIERALQKPEYSLDYVHDIAIIYVFELFMGVIGLNQTDKYLRKS
jgi:hypothetical protein